MSRNLADDIESDIADVFLNADEFAVNVTYQRGSHSVAIVALVSNSVFETSNEYGVTRLATRDYLIKPSTLILNSVVTKPERGDKIIEGTSTFMATSPTGAPVWSYDDENNLLIKVHCVLSRET